MSGVVISPKRSHLSLSLKRRRRIDDTMPKKKRGGDIKMKTIDLTESPSKRQTVITNYYLSPNKSESKSSVGKLVKNSDFTFDNSLKVSLDSTVNVGASCSKSNVEIKRTSDAVVSNLKDNSACPDSQNEVIIIEDSTPENSQTEESVPFPRPSDPPFFREDISGNYTVDIRHQVMETSQMQYSTDDQVLDNVTGKILPSISIEENIDASAKPQSSKSLKTIRVKSPDKLFSKEVLSNEFKSPVKTPSKKKRATPGKSSKSSSPKKINEALSQIGGSGENVTFSPKIKRRPGKYFDDQSMPEKLLKTPVKTPSPKKIPTPRKRNLLKDFDNSPGQSKLDNFCVSHNQLNDDYFENITEECWKATEALINNPEAMEKIREENKKNQTPVQTPTKDITTNPLADRSIDISPSTTPSKVRNRKTPSQNEETFIHYLLSNPMIKEADKRNILNAEGFKEMRSSFSGLSSQCQQIYAKMFNRIPVWYRVDSDLVKKYSDLHGDIKGIVATLVQHKFITDDLSDVELLDLLKLLQVPELKTICKHFNVTVSEGNTMKKDNLVKALLNHACTQRVLFGNLTHKIKARVIKELGQCVRLTEVFRQMFNLLVVVATYPYHMDEEKLRLGNLIRILNDLKYRKKTFPAYIFRPDIAFQDIKHLRDYGEALSFVAEYSNYVENKDWDSAALQVIEAKQRFTLFLADEHNIELLGRLGGHLVKFTAGYQYGYCLSDGIGVLKKDTKNTEECIQVIELLLSQQRYLQRKRGIWYDELALVHQTKKKDLVAACTVVKYGLEDEYVDRIRKLALSQRAATLVKRKSSVLSDGLRAQLSALMLQDIVQPQQHTITALCHEGVAGKKQVFYRECDDGKEYCSVEEIVIDYYKNTASPPYAYGLHDEGRSLMNIILGCFYDVIYHHPEGDSMFHCHMQVRPLDWGGTHFYTRRKQQIQDVLERLRAGGVMEIMATLQNLLSDAEDVDSVINWDYIRPDRLPRIKELLDCLGVEVFVKIAEHVIKDYKTYHSGFPDLILWDPPSGRCLLVEVKGPNDKLSLTQTVWLENLTRFGAAALVCHVESPGSRKRKVT